VRSALARLETQRAGGPLDLRAVEYRTGSPSRLVVTMSSGTGPWQEWDLAEGARGWQLVQTFGDSTGATTVSVATMNPDRLDALVRATLAKAAGPVSTVAWTYGSASAAGSRGWTVVLSQVDGARVVATYA
jgi:hypothetical protein